MVVLMVPLRGYVHDSRQRPSERILVTGGVGLLGSHLIDRILARGDKVIYVDNQLCALLRSAPAGLAAQPRPRAKNDLMRRRHSAQGPQHCAMPARTATPVQTKINIQ